MSDPERQLLEAVNSNKFEAVRAILKNHPKVDVNKNKCIHWAATFGKLEMVKLLMSAGAKLNDYGMAGKETPLYIAVAHHHMEIVKLLLDAGADPNLGSQSNGVTPIMRTSTLDIIELLIKHGADVNVTDHKGASPLLKAVSTKRVDLVRMFLAAGANIDHADKDGYTPLIMAVENGYDDIVSVLLQDGADREICAASGRSVYEIATKPSTKKLLEASAPPHNAGSTGATDTTKSHKKKSWLHNLFHTTHTKVSAPPISVEETAAPEEHVKSSSTEPTGNRDTGNVNPSSNDGGTGGAAASSAHSNDGGTATGKMSTSDAPYRPLHRVQHTAPVPAAVETVQFATAIASTADMHTDVGAYSSGSSVAVSSAVGSGLAATQIAQVVGVSEATIAGVDSRVLVLEQRLATLERVLHEQTGHIQRLESVVEAQGREIIVLKTQVHSLS